MKGEQSSSYLKQVQGKSSAPVHQGFMPSQAGSSSQNVYLMAIRSMLGQGFFNFVSVEQKGQPFNQEGTSGTFDRNLRQSQDTPSRSSSGTQSQGGSGGRVQNDFLASTPQYLLPQFGKNQSKERVTLNDNTFQRSQPERKQTSPEGSRGFSPSAENGSGRSRPSASMQGAHYSGEDVENRLLEHYRATFASSRDTYRSRLPSSLQDKTPPWENRSQSSPSRSQMSSPQDKAAPWENGLQGGLSRSRYPSSPQENRTQSGVSRSQEAWTPPSAQGSFAPAGRERMSPGGEPPRSETNRGAARSADEGNAYHLKMKPSGAEKEALEKAPLDMKLPNSFTLGDRFKTKSGYTLPEQSSAKAFTFNEEQMPRLSTRQTASQERGMQSEGSRSDAGFSGHKPESSLLGRSGLQASPQDRHLNNAGIFDSQREAQIRPRMEPPREQLRSEAQEREEALLQKKDELREFKETGLREAPGAKAMENISKPWESALKALRQQAMDSSEQLKTQDMLQSDDLQQGEASKPKLLNPDKSRMDVPRETQSEAPMPFKPPVERENLLVKLREEVKQKLESPLSNEKPLADLASRSEGIQSQVQAHRKEDTSETKPQDFQEKAFGTPGETGKSETKAPREERSFAARSEQKKGTQESQSRRQYDAPLQAIREFGEHSPQMGEAIGASAMASDLSQSAALTHGRFEAGKAENQNNQRIIEELRRHERQPGEGQNGQDEQSMNERSGGRSETTLQMRTQRPDGQQPQSAAPQMQQFHHQQEVFRQEVKEQVVRNAAATTDSKKQETVAQTTQAVKHASTSIESILKKSHTDVWTGEEMAAKLIALLMKSASNYTYEHSSRVIDLSVALAQEMGITDEKQLKEIEDGAMFHDIGEVELDLENAPPQVRERLSRYIGAADLKNCSFLHDIGKVKIPDSILYKPTRLTDEEFEIIKQHPVIGEQILKPIIPLQHALPVVRHHHERFDGKGYPDGISGAAIPYAARIVSITDSFDAMVSDRPYRKGMPIDKALAELKKGSGTQFDPELVAAFVKVVEREYQ